MQNAEKRTQIQEERSALPVSEEVRAIDAQLAAAPADAELWMKKGLALRRQMLFREAVEAYSEGLTRQPFHALLYRHRGHAHINLRRYQEGAADLELSARIDPSNWDTWYHLGLGYYLLGDYARARAAYERCIDLTDNVDSLVAVTDWYWLTLMHLGETEKAAEAVARITGQADVKENRNYFQRVLVYNGQKDPEEVVREAEGLSDHRFATQTYGISYYYELKGNKARAKEILEEIARRDETWSGFAESAAHERLKNWN